jgi:hypothetical protein
MSNIIRIKRRLDDGSAVAGAPSNGSLLNAELAFNEVDGTLYYGKGSGAGEVAEEIVAIGGNGYIDSVVNTASVALSAQIQSSTEMLSGQISSLHQTIEDELGAMHTEMVGVSGDLAQLISDEAFARSSADTALQGSIDAVNTRVDNVLSNVDSVALNSLSEIVTAFQDADSDLNGAITALASAATTALASVSGVLQGEIEDESYRAVAAEGALSTALATASAALAQSIADEATARGTAVSDEATARALAVSDLHSEMVSVSGALSQSVADEAAARVLAVSDLHSEMVSVSGILDFKIDSSVSTINGSIDDLSTTVHTVSTTLKSDIGAAQDAAETYTDSKISALINFAPEALDTLKEIADQLGNDEGVVSALINTVASVSGALSTAIGQEVTDRQTEVVRLEGLISSEEYARGVAVAGVQTALDSEVTTRGTEITRVEGLISTEVTARGTAVAAALADAKGYTDTAISSLVDGAPELLNTLKELASAIGDDQNYFVHIAEQIAALSTSTGLSNTTEVTRAEAAEAALDVRVSDIEDNYLDKRVGGTVSADLSVTGNFEVGSGAATMFVGRGVVGVNTEAPSEALHVVGNGKFTGNLMGSGTSAITGFIMDGGLF